MSYGTTKFYPHELEILFTDDSQALIGYIFYELPEADRNINTLVEMINSMEVREDDENHKNPIDILFDELTEKDPEHFAVRQYKKYKLAAGVVL